MPARRPSAGLVLLAQSSHEFHNQLMTEKEIVLETIRALPEIPKNKCLACDLCDSSLGIAQIASLTSFVIPQIASLTSFVIPGFRHFATE